MAGATTVATSFGAAVATYMQGLVPTLDSRETPMSDILIETPVPGGDSVDWVVNSAGNTSSTDFAEGDAPSAAGAQTYYQLSIAKSAYQLRTMYQITGTAEDSARGGYFAAKEAEMLGALLDHKKYEDGVFVTAIEAAVDSAGSYAGQTRSNANTASYEAAVTPTLAEMQLAWQSLAADPRSVDMTQVALLAPIEFQMDYLDVATGVTNFQHNSAQTGQVDAGKFGNGAMYNQKWFTTIGTMTDSTSIWTPPTNLLKTTFRGVKVEEYAKNDDSVTMAITSVVVPWVRNPRAAAKLT